jgi:hypothetical protein
MLTSLPIHCVLAISFIWLVFCVVVYYVLPRQGFTLHQRPAVLVALVVVIALVVRLIPAVVLPRGAGYDIESFRRVSETFLKGEGVYSSPLVSGRHPYFPLQVYLIGAAMWLSRGTGLPFILTVKWAPILADSVLAVLIFQAVQRLSGFTGQAFVSSLLYALNPISVLVSAYHGQFDAEPAFLLALSWYFWHFGSSSERRIVLSALALGFAVLNKTWPALFLPIVLLRLRSTRQRLAYGLITLAIPITFTVLYVVAFREDPSPLLKRALTHAGVPGWWGPGAVVSVVGAMTGWGEPVLNWLAHYGRWFVFAGVGLCYWLTRRQASVEALVTALLVLYVSTSGFGLQWVLWVVPFALLAGDVRGLDWYVLGTLVYMLPSYYGYHLDSTLANAISFERLAVLMHICAIPAWVITLVWVIRRLVTARRESTSYILAKG